MNSVVIIANLSKSILNRHEQVREWAIRSKSKCYAIAKKNETKEEEGKGNEWNKDEIYHESIEMKMIARTFVPEHGNLIKGNFMQLAVLFNDDVIDADDMIMTMCNTCTSSDHDPYILSGFASSSVILGWNSNEFVHNVRCIIKALCNVHKEKFWLNNSFGIFFLFL